MQTKITIPGLKDGVNSENKHGRFTQCQWCVSIYLQHFTRTSADTHGKLCVFVSLFCFLFFFKKQRIRCYLDGYNNLKSTYCTLSVKVEFSF